MSELLTTRQLQELLKIDRVTVYRMLHDGRLKGIKVGNQWRFTQQEVDRLLGKAEEIAPVAPKEDLVSDFPVHCVEKVIEVFAGILGVCAFAADLEGRSLTRTCNLSPFCRLMQSTPEGLAGCQASWRHMAMRINGGLPFLFCHAGINYLRSQIYLDGKPVGWLFTGQYYTTQPDWSKEDERMDRLAERYHLPPRQLSALARKVPVLSHKQQAQIQEWAPRISATLQSILCERSDLLSRLQRISEISAITHTLP
jgi:excisionase family DNA binding protein